MFNHVTKTAVGYLPANGNPAALSSLPTADLGTRFLMRIGRSTVCAEGQTFVVTATQVPLNAVALECRVNKETKLPNWEFVDPTYTKSIIGSCVNDDLVACRF